MLVKTLEERFGYDTPIFTDEILKLFPQYTRAYVFRLINAAEQSGKLIQADTGTYYLPRMTLFGPSVITASDIARKKYIQNGSDVYGIYSGLVLQNSFLLTTQMANTPEIITNNASARCRKVVIDGKPFILRKSRTEITAENVCAYQVLQLFTEANGVEVNEDGKQSILKFISKSGVERNALLELAKSFPAKTLQKLIYSGVLYNAT